MGWFLHFFIALRVDIDDIGASCSAIPGHTPNIIRYHPVSMLVACALMGRGCPKVSYEFLLPNQDHQSRFKANPACQNILCSLAVPQ